MCCPAYTYPVAGGAQPPRAAGNSVRLGTRPSPQCGRVPNAAETPRRASARFVFLRICPHALPPSPAASMGESDYEEADDDFDDEGAAVRIP